MKSRFHARAIIATLAVAIAGGTWLALAAALQREPPAPREVLLGAGVVCIVLAIVIGGLAIIETRVLGKAERRMRRFLADASHELRTPIAGIQASAETLLRVEHDGAAREKLILQILREGHRAGRLIDDLLVITRLDQGIPLASQPFDLVPLARAAAEATRELAPSLDVQLDAPPHAELQGDQQRIGQILDNLLSNARQVTPGGGQIIIRITVAPSAIEVVVTDTGPGIAAPDRERIFERFARLEAGQPRAADGNGLGLAIARSIASAHAGTLTCAEPSGQGARFVLRLPRRAG